MSDQLADWWVHEVDVATYLGSTGTGDQWADPIQQVCWFEERRRLVKNTEGREVISEASLAAPASAANLFTPQSKVTTPTGQTRQVITLAAATSGGLELPDHIEVTLT